MTNRELIEAAVVLRALDDPTPPQIRDDWFRWAPASAAWRKAMQAQREGRALGLADYLADPATTEVCEAMPQVALYFANIVDATQALQAYVDRDWLAQLWRDTLRQEDLTNPREAMTKLASALTDRLSETATTPLVSAREAAMQVFQGLEARRDGQRTGLSYGWASWDALTNGLEGGQLVIVGARTGVGKTLIGANLARNWAKGGHPCLYFSLEMHARKLMARWMAVESGLNSLTLARGRLHSQTDWDTISEAMGKTGEWPIWIREEPTSLRYAVQLTQDAVRQRGVQAVVVDYAGLLENDASYPGESTAAQVGRIAKGLKNLAMGCDIPIVCLVQLNRQAEHRDVPSLADLRDSGDWEASADVVWLLYRNDVPDEIQALCAKNRDGEANVTLRMGWQKPTALVWDKERV